MEKWRGRVVRRFVLASVVLVSVVTVARAGEPLEKIRQTIEDVLAILADEALRVPERMQERRAKIRQAILARFGFEEMARRALGIHWRKLKPAQRREFVTLFSELLERSYTNKIASYGEEEQEIRYLKEAIDADYASVRTAIVNRRDLDVEVEYRLLRRHNDWQVYDVVIEGVSLVNNYRTQFNKIIRRESYDALVKKLKLKLEQEKAAETSS